MTRTSYQNRSIAVLGLGSSGMAAARLLLGEGARVSVLESADGERQQLDAETLRGEGALVLLGSEAEADATLYDLGVLSPGIDPVVPLVRRFIERHGEGHLIGELELSYTLCACPVIAITGTNGKTTTTQLIEAMLNACEVKTLAAGNIGPAFAARVRESEGLDLMTLEVSSFQLETIVTFRPQIALWLNFRPDHLDRYPDMEAYRAAKLRLFENQQPGDWVIHRLGEQLPLAKGVQVITFSATESGADLEWDAAEEVIRFHGAPLLPLAQTKLRGLHNVENLMAALAVGAAKGLPFVPMIEALCQYTPLPHRCESVATVAGVEYINDSKATNLDALEKALLSETRRVILIAGGKEKGFPFDTLTPLVGQKVRRAILIGEIAEKIAASWGDTVPCLHAATLEEAVHLARATAQKGEVVLFSPGTSSFDMFRNYAERGDRFRAAVAALNPSTPSITTNP